MRKLSILVFLMFTLLLSGTSQALTTDVTSPGDAIKGYPDDGDWPGGEAPLYVIDDNPNTKFLHFKGDNETSGFQVTAALNGRIVTGITLTTGNDAPERDPVVVEISGSNVGIDGPYTPIATVNVTDFDQVDPWPRNTKNATPLTFANAVAYDHYQVLFTVIRLPENGCCMQVSEVELLADVTPPAGWGLKNIGNPGIPGSAIDDAGIWTVRGSGHDIWGNADGFYYVFRPLSGDGSLQVNLTSMDVTSGWAKVGPAIRETLEAGSRHAMTAFTGSNGAQFVWRMDTNGGSNGIVKDDMVIKVPPNLLRITRTGDEILSEYGEEVPWLPHPDWYVIGGFPVSVPMNTDVTIGVVVCATNNGALNKAVLENIVLTAPPYEKAWGMSPDDGATRLPFTPTLSWMPGDSATAHDVYLGTDPAGLYHVSAQTLGNESYTPGTPLLANTTYYWQIVEQPGAVAGPVYSFKTLYEAPWYAGSLNWERWLGLPTPTAGPNKGGQEIETVIHSYKYQQQPPDSVGEMPDAYSPNTDGPIDYGVRLSGHVIPGTSGDYTFWIAADDGCQLRLNTDNDCADMTTRIAGWYAYSGNFDAHPEQKSAPIYLEAGQKYAIQALLKEKAGGDWVEVAWEGPDTGGVRTRITGTFLTNAYALNPKPVSSTSITPLEATTLSWTAGKYATSQEVLFGTSPAAMAPIATLPANPAVIVETSTLAMPAIASGNTYYWQVNSTDGTDTWVGDVWCFTVSDWVSRDIGLTRIADNQPIPPAGSSTYDPVTGLTVLKHSGHELWGNFDTFHYRYTTVNMTRDTGMIQARILSIQPADSWRRGGVMIRENLGATSRKFMMHKTGHNNLRMQRRDNPGNGTGNGPDHWDRPYPMWLRITRDHSQFDAYFSEDGENWNHAGSRTINMEPDKFVYIGLAQCHHPGVDQSTLTTGTFDNWSYTTPDITQSWNLQPPNGSTMVDIHATLSWGAGEGATEHRVYFSEDEEAVVNRTVEPIVLPAETLSVQVGPLTMGNVYYWCVDEVINPVTPGEVVSFTAETYRTIDDFEAYTIIPEPLPEQQTVLGDIIVESVPPPDQVWNEPEAIVVVEAVDPGEDCLVSRWDFEADFTDSGPGGNDGTANGGVSLVTDVERGNVAEFDGASGSYVDCGNPANLNFTTNDWTISAWVNTTVTGKPKGVIYANGGDGGGGIRSTLGVGESKDNRVSLTSDDDGNPPGSTYGKRQSHGKTHVTDGEWHHVVGVRRGGRQYIYTDGVLEDNDSLKGADFDLTGMDQANVHLGCIWNQGGSKLEKWFTGMLDDVRVYNCALTDGNIRYLAGLGDLVFDKIGYYGPMIAHYTLDEGSGDVAADSSGNGLDGAITDAQWVATTADGSAACLDFNGFGGNVINELAGPYLNGLFELSVSMWVQSDLTATDKGFFMGSASGSDRHGVRYDKVGGSADPDGQEVLKYGVRTTEGNEEDESSEYLQTTEWQHVIVSWKSGEGLKLYINGVVDIPTFDAGAKGSFTEGYDRIWVGKGSKDMDDDESWDGRIDDVRIYAYRLSEGEARYLAGLDHLRMPTTYQPLIGHWTADGHANDSSGNENHGTPVGGNVDIVADAERGLVASFTGGNNTGVDVGDSELFNFQNNCTLSAWVNLTNWGHSWGNVIIGKRGEDGVGWQLRRFGGDNRFSWTTRGLGGDDWPRSNQTIDMNRWYHLGAVRDGNRKHLYIDGALEMTQNTNWNRINPCPHTVYIGARARGNNSGPERTFNGMIDEVRVYNVALTYEQILTLAEYVNDNPLKETWSGRAAAAPALQYTGGAHAGAQCMRVEYTGSGAVTRLEPFGDGKHPHGHNGDFSLGGAQALSLWFKGDPDNAPGTLFAQLTTVVPSGHTQRVLYDGDPEDLQSGDWVEWNITLKALSTGKPADPIEEMGLPITKIKDVGIGVIGAGSGVVYFDDIHLDLPKCVAKYGPVADYTGDCLVDERDARVLIGEWLDGDYTIYAAAPNPLGLVAKYLFEGNADDSGPNGYHGTENGDPVYVAGNGLAIDFDGDGDFVYTGKSASDLGIGGNSPRTVTSWVFTRAFDNGGIYDVGNRAGGEDFCLRTLGDENRWRIQYWGGDYDFTYDSKDKWVHFGHVHDGAYTKIYADGQLIVNWAKTINTPDTNPFQIGCYGWQNDYLDGIVDDVHVYNYALSNEEVVDTMGTGDVYVPLEAITNLYDEEPMNYKKINFFDYAALLEEWLVEILWPAPEDWL
ncbi:MAG: LamG-like jellyroll fold domain-containing protein [Planctomycetota bacterium]